MMAPLTKENIGREKARLFIKGKNIVLVSFLDRHLHDPSYLRWLRDYEVMRFVNRPEYLNNIPFQEVVSYIEAMTESDHDILFAIETVPERQFIGTFKIGHINWHSKVADIGMLIGDKSFWRKGIAYQSYSAALPFCFKELGFHKVVGGFMEPNVGAKKLLMSLGFTQEGLFRDQDFLEGTHCGHYHYGLLREEYEKSKRGKL